MNRITETTWPENHALNGGTFVMNTSGKHTEEIAESVEAFNDPQIFMIGNQLHTTRVPFNLSDFWAAHRKRFNQTII